MIQANELRTGNFVKYDTEKDYWEINAIDSSCDEVDLFNYDHLSGIDVSELEPIPLSEDILLKAGFEKLDDTKNVYRILVNDFEISVNIRLSYAYIDTQWGQAAIKNPIFKYLHQLQNLYFALTNQELTLNL